MRWPLQHVATLSLHGRPAELIHPHIAPGNRILALTSDATTAPHVANLLVERGYGRSVLTVLENLGGPDERIASAEAHGFDLAIGDFYVLAIDCVADPGAPLLPPVPGLPDDAFVSDGQLTKREVRAATLAQARALSRRAALGRRRRLRLDRHRMDARRARCHAPSPSSAKASACR